MIISCLDCSFHWQDGTTHEEKEYSCFRSNVAACCDDEPVAGFLGNKVEERETPKPMGCCEDLLRLSTKE